MALPVTIPNTFANATSSIPLSQLDTNFSTLANAVNGLNSGSETLANLKATTANVGVLTVTGNATIGDASTDTVTLNSTLTANTAVIFAAGTSAAPSITTTGDTNTGIFFPAADTIAFTEGGAEAMRIDSSGNVGIGTSSPSGRLHINTTSADCDVRFSATTSGVAALSIIGYNSSTTISGSNGGATLTLWNKDSTANTYNAIESVDASGSLTNKISFVNASDANNEGYMVFQTRPSGGSITERMRIDSSGNVGIGTSSPGTNLQINSATGGAIRLQYTGNSGYGQVETNSNNELVFKTSGANERMRIDSSGNVGIGTSSTTTYGGTALVKTINIGSLNNISAGFSDAVTGTLRIAHASNQNIINFDASNLCFQSGGTTPTERARITSGGNLLVGTTDNSASAGVGFKVNYSATVPYCSVVGSDSTNNYSGFLLYSTGAGAYRFYVGYGGTVYATNTTISGISDVRLKENIRDLDVGLDAVLALKPRKFDWKEGKGADVKNARGFVAQEFEQVFPDLIDEWKDPAPEGEEPYKSVRADLIPVLVKAIQELKAITDAQATRIEALEAEVAAMKAGNGN